MQKTSIKVDIDEGIKAQATELFNALGLDMSTAINLFLHQCVLRGSLPFEHPRFSAEALEVMAEAKRISSDTTVKGYKSSEELKAALDD